MEKEQPATATEARGNNGRNRGRSPNSAPAQKRRRLNPGRQVTFAFMITRPSPLTLNP